jgi:hypothetical protein
MSDDDKGEKTQREPPSKFEWRPEDVIILSEEECDAAVAEYEEWLAEKGRDTEN